MAKTPSAKNRAEVKAKKVAAKKRIVPQRKQAHVDGIQANVEASAKDAARAKRLARKAAIDEEQSQVIEEIMTGGSEEPEQIGHDEVKELRLMVEGLTTRLVETQSILSSFTMKVEMLLLRGRESASDADCLIVEDEGPTGIAESELMKHDCIFMRNMNSTGSNLLVRTCILLNFTII